MNHHLLLSRSLIVCLLLLSLLFCFSFAEDDVRCLQEVKKSLNDPDGKLNSWNFSNTTVGFICNFAGVTCWNVRENRLSSLDLEDNGLTGSIPDSLRLCHSLVSVNLTGNSLSGTIPPQICTWLPYLVTLDLSRNSLTGPIPEDLANCSYLNYLILDDNKLSGNIPYQFSSLRRLKKFSVANNDLSGRVPPFNYQLELHFDGNSGLCGGPSGKCGGLSKKSLAIIIAAGVSGAAASLLLVFGLRWWYVVKSNKRSKRGYGIGQKEHGLQEL